MGSVLQLIASYEHNIAAVEELTLRAYQAAIVLRESLDLLDEKGEPAKKGPPGDVAGHGPSRKRDLDRRLESVLADSARKRKAIEDERRRVHEQLTKYLDSHKQLADYLRRQMAGKAREDPDHSTLNAMLGIIRTRYEDMGRRLFDALREFRAHLEVFRREQAELNTRMQRLADRGAGLRTEDIKQLESAASGRDMGLRREEMDGLLARFQQQSGQNRYTSGEKRKGEWPGTS